MYNGAMTVFDPRPGRSGSLAPGKARFSALSPTIVFNGDDPYLVLGAPGATYITMGNLQVMLNVLDFGMSAQEAVIAPRFAALSNILELSNRILRSAERDLRDQGYPILRHPVSYTFAWVHAIRIKDGKWDGGANPATNGMAMSLSMTVLVTVPEARRISDSAQACRTGRRSPGARSYHPVGLEELQQRGKVRVAEADVTVVRYRNRDLRQSISRIATAAVAAASEEDPSRGCDMNIGGITTSSTASRQRQAGGLSEPSPSVATNRTTGKPFSMKNRPVSLLAIWVAKQANELAARAYLANTGSIAMARIAVFGHGRVTGELLPQP